MAYANAVSINLRINKQMNAKHAIGHGIYLILNLYLKNIFKSSKCTNES